MAVDPERFGNVQRGLRPGSEELQAAGQTAMDSAVSLGADESLGLKPIPPEVFATSSSCIPDEWRNLPAEASARQPLPGEVPAPDMGDRKKYTLQRIFGSFPTGRSEFTYD